MKMGFLEGQTVLQLWDFRSWLLFRYWKNKDCANKVDKCDKTGKSRGWNNSKFIDLFTPASATASSLDSPMGNAPRKCNHWRLSYVWEKNNVCSQPSQVRQFPLTHKMQNATAVLWNSSVGKPPSLAGRTENSPALQARRSHQAPVSLPLHGAPPGIRGFSSHFGLFPPIPTWLQAQPHGFDVQLFILQNSFLCMGQPELLFASHPLVQRDLEHQKTPQKQNTNSSLCQCTKCAVRSVPKGSNILPLNCRSIQIIISTQSLLFYFFVPQEQGFPIANFSSGGSPDHCLKSIHRLKDTGSYSLF